MAYPTTIDSYIAPSGTSLLTSPDHAGQHASFGSAIVNIENKLGIGAGSAGVNQLLFGQGAGTATWGSVGTAITFASSNFNNGTLNNDVMGTPTLQAPTFNGAGTNSGTFLNGVYNSATLGTPVITGGTLITPIINNGTYGTINSPASQDLKLIADTGNSKVMTTTIVRQGGTVTDWSVPGTANFYVANVFIQAGVFAIGTSATLYTPVFPVAFSKTPTVTVTQTSNTTSSTGAIRNITAGSFGYVTQAASNDTLHWIAIGER